MGKTAFIAISELYVLPKVVSYTTDKIMMSLLLVYYICLTFLAVVTTIKPEIVAFGTGNNCMSCDNLCDDGRALIDSYAVAMARRALLK